VKIMGKITYYNQILWVWPTSANIQIDKIVHSCIKNNKLYVVGGKLLKNYLIIGAFALTLLMKIKLILLFKTRIMKIDNLPLQEN